MTLSAEEMGIDRLEYIVSHPTALTEPIVGNVEVTSDTTTFRLTSLPVATDYTISLSVYSDTGERFCIGSAIFPILLNDTTFVAMDLLCSTSANNDIGVA